MSDADQGVVQFRGVLAQPIAAGITVGNIKFTWYIRFHGRTKRAGVVRAPLMNFASKFEEKENQDPQEDVSQMSYSELQAQVKSMLRK